jgi:hypothetical protein
MKEAGRMGGKLSFVHPVHPIHEAESGKRARNYTSNFEHRVVEAEFEILLVSNPHAFLCRSFYFSCSIFSYRI